MRYEIAVSVETAKIVWANGPWPCGAFSDIRIFRGGLKSMLKVDELAIGDSGYTDTRCIQPPGTQHPMNVTLARIRARHETVNKRLKQFSVLRQRFRHDIARHGDCFFAVLNITHLMLQEEPLFSVDF